MNEIQQQFEKKQKLLAKASNTAGLVVVFGFVFGVGLGIANNYFQYVIINSIINSAIATAAFFSAYQIGQNTIFPYYLKMTYFHFLLTAFVFGLITQWSLKSLFFSSEISLVSFKIFILNNIIFHLGEFYFVCFYYPTSLKWKSFLINHSPGYNAAFACALLEYFFGTIFPNFFFFQFQNRVILIVIGCILAIVGHVFRIGAQQTAKSNFNHLVQSQKQDNHQLVTNGVYSFSRHPSYLGFYLYSLGGQITLGNIFCFFAYSYVLFQFFLYRIVDEEYYLVKFFGDEYVKYRERVPIRIPFLEYAMHKKFKYED